MAQISNIRVIKEAMREASFLYAELEGLGAPMRYCDVGGGLAIDYEVDPGPDNLNPTFFELQPLNAYSALWAFLHILLPYSCLKI